MGDVPNLMGCLGCEGTYEIGLPQCPHCGTRSPMYETSEESGMPTITSGGASNAGEQAETEAAQAVDVPEAPKTETEAEQVPETAVEAPAAVLAAPEDVAEQAEPEPEPEPEPVAAVPAAAGEPATAETEPEHDETEAGPQL